MLGATPAQWGHCRLSCCRDGPQDPHMPCDESPGIVTQRCRSHSWTREVNVPHDARHKRNPGWKTREAQNPQSLTWVCRDPLRIETGGRECTVRVSWTHSQMKFTLGRSPLGGALYTVISVPQSFKAFLVGMAYLMTYMPL